MDFSTFLQNSLEIQNEKNFLECKKQLQNNEPKYLKKIEDKRKKVNDSLNETEYLHLVKNNDSLIRVVAMIDPFKQTIHEKVQVKYCKIKHNIHLTLPDKKCFLNNLGELVFLNKKPEINTTKSIDFCLKFNGINFICYAKYIKNSGGNQDNQINDMLKFIKYSSRHIGNYKFLCLIDGEYGEHKSLSFTTHKNLIICNSNTILSKLLCF